MHTLTIHSEFLRLRVQGLSLSSIGRRLGVSKPTLIKWNRQSQSEIATKSAAQRHTIQNEIATTATHEIADLTRRLTGLKQELFSRAVRDIRTSDLEIIAGQLRQRLDSLESVSTPSESETLSTLNPPLSTSVTSPSSLSSSAAPSEIENAIPNPSEPIRTPKN
jgi:hypothetical protein